MPKNALPEFSLPTTTLIMQTPFFHPPISIEQFLQEYWQKAPVVFRAAVTPYPDFIDADEMAGLAMEEEVESRIIKHQRIAETGSSTTEAGSSRTKPCKEQWQLHHGPFDEATLTRLPQDGWTLLIQTLEHWWPGVDQLKQAFDFIPRWRLDDIMLSFATDGGGVGPHLDQYDVFLIQGKGQRRWRVGHKDQPVISIQQPCGIKQIEPFNAELDIVMAPGDVLYLPPNTPHWGESIGESYCYSVGFRAPTQAWLVETINHKLESSPNSEKEILFTDSERKHADHCNQLEPALIQWAQNELRQLANNKSMLAEMLAQQLSQSKLDPFESPLLEFEHTALDAEQPVTEIDFEGFAVKPSFSLIYEPQDTQINLWIEGEKFVFPVNSTPLVTELTCYRPVSAKNWSFFKHSLAIRETLARIKSKGYLFKPAE